MTEGTRGSVLIRASDQKTEDGRRAVMIIGVLGIDDDFPLEPEHTYVVTPLWGAPGLLQIHLDSVQPLPHPQSAGWDVPDLLKSKIWRV